MKKGSLKKKLNQNDDKEQSLLDNGTYSNREQINGYMNKNPDFVSDEE